MYNTGRTHLAGFTKSHLLDLFIQNQLNFNNGGDLVSYSLEENLSDEFEISRNGTTLLTLDESGNLVITGSLTATGLTGINCIEDDDGTTKICLEDTPETIEFTTNSLERMRIASDGNVGIGTNNPLSIFTVKTGTSMLEFSEVSSSAFFNSSGPNSSMTFISVEANTVGFSDAVIGDSILKTGLNRMLLGSGGINPSTMVLDTTGNVGIGTAPSTLLHLLGDSPILTIQNGSGAYDGENTVLQFKNSGFPQAQLNSFTDTNGPAGPFHGSLTFSTYQGTSFMTEVMRMDFNGNVAIDTTSPASKFVVNGSTNSAHFLHGDANTTDTLIHIGGAIGNQRKTAIITEPTGSFGKNKLHFALNSAADLTDATSANAVMTLSDDGNIRLGPAGDSNKDTVISTGSQLRIHANDTGGDNSFTSLILASGVADAFDGNITFETDGTEKMRLDNEGQLGIGIAAPTQMLDIRAASNPTLLIRETGAGVSGRIYLGNAGHGISRGESIGSFTDGNDVVVHTAGTTGSIGFQCNGGEATLDHTGNFGIGTTPTAKLHVDLNNLQSVLFAGGGVSDRVHLQIQNGASEIDVAICGGNNDFFVGALDGDAIVRAVHQTLHIGTFANVGMLFYTNAVETARIRTSGDLKLSLNNASITNNNDVAIAGEIPYAHYNRFSVAQSHSSSGGFVTLDWQTELDDRGGFSESTGVITVPATGLYSVTATVNIANNTTGYRGADIVMGSGTIHSLTISAATGAAQAKLNIAGIFNVTNTGTNTIKVDVFQDSGGSLDMFGELAIVRIGNSV